VILLLAIIAGLVAGIARARFGGRDFCNPSIKSGWLILIAVIPQLYSFHLPGLSEATLDKISVGVLVSSQIVLLLFIWANRTLPGFGALGVGLIFNLLVIIANGGLMPISPETVHLLSPDALIKTSDLGSRLGTSKDILLSIENTNLWLLSDIIVLPKWIPYRVAFSIGDIFIAVGAFWLLWVHGNIDDVQTRYLRTKKV